MNTEYTDYLQQTQPFGSEFLSPASCSDSAVVGQGTLVCSFANSNGVTIDSVCIEDVERAV